MAPQKPCHPPTRHNRSCHRPEKMKVLPFVFTLLATVTQGGCTQLAYMFYPDQSQTPPREKLPRITLSTQLARWVGKRIEVEGIATDDPAGATVLVERTPVYVDEMTAWPPLIEGHRTWVSGRLMLASEPKPAHVGNARFVLTKPSLLGAPLSK